MIVCCGEALIDMLPRESRAGEPAFAPYPGGSVFNTAIALGRLGAPVEFLSGLSSDPFGQLLRETLVASNVGTRYAPVSNRPTTLAFVRLENRHASYLFYDENTAGRMLAERDLPDLDQTVAALHFGAISLISEPCGSAYEALMAREHTRRVVMLDPNIRPDFIPDREKHLARMRRMIAMADIVKLSEEDLAWFGESGGIGEIAARWLGQGPRLIVVTRGGSGSAAFTSRHEITVPAEIRAVADTVGAGDTFNAGLLAWLWENGLLTKSALVSLGEAQVAEALKFAARAAAITVSRPGADPPWRKELDQGRSASPRSSR
jgi:fructokinase